MKKGFFKTLFVCVILSCVLGLAACNRSAYDVAVKNGFGGSEAEWLESLKGSDGTGIDIYDLYNAYLEINPNATFEEFLSTYLTLEYSPSQLAVNKALTNTVSIISAFKKKTAGFPIGSTEKTEYSAGSGVIYKLDTEAKQAYVITNYHVVYDSESTTSVNGIIGIASAIQLNTYAHMTANYVVNAEFVGGSMANDIAVLKVSGAEFDALVSNAFVQAAQKGDSNKIGVGESVYAVGNPEALGISATAGVVSVDSEYIQMSALNNPLLSNVMRVIRVDAAINGGNSGGGLFNNNGELIGIVNAKIVDESIENIGYAIPSNIATAIADSFIEKDGKKSVLGINSTAASTKTIFADSRVQIIETIRIEDISKNSIADTNGLKAGDYIQSATLGDGTINRLQILITRNFHLSDFVLNAIPDETLTLTIIRDNATMTVTIKLDSSKRVAF